MFSQLGKNPMKVFFMLFDRIGEDEDVIKVYVDTHPNP